MTGVDVDLSLRRVDPESPELREWFSVAAAAFKDPQPITQERMDVRRPALRENRLSAAYANGRLIGTYRSWDVGLTVPGGRVLADAISSVAVLPTHRRRGAMSTMIEADLREAVERGIPVAVLIASEAPIYGRFGFGPSTEVSTWTVDLRAARVRPDVPDDCQILMVAEDELRAVGPPAYQGARLPGAIDRIDHWWDTTLGVIHQPDREHGVHLGAVAVDGSGQVQGYLRYRVEPQWTDRVSSTTVHLEDLQVTRPEAYSALWRYLLELDLAATIRAEDRPVDEALPWLLTDQRAARQSARCDFEWTRLLDTAGALSARSYETAGHAVLEVIDEAGWAEGRYLLEADEHGAGHCTRTSQNPDVTLPVATLSALWLGGGDLLAALLAGRARENRTGGARRLAALLRTSREPWAATWF